MNETLFIGFILATFVIVATPGPSVALASAQALRSGPRAVFYCVFGDGLGSFFHITIATIGLQFLLQISALILPWLQVLGGGYILYLAYKSFVDLQSPCASEQGNMSNDKEVFLSGFLACVTNPKAIIFFLALFPGFIDPNINVTFQTLIYGAIFITLDALFITVYAFAALYAFKFGLARVVNYNAVSGAGLVIIGLLLVVRGLFEAFFLIELL